VSGPLFDRIDLHVRMSVVQEGDINFDSDNQVCMSSQTMRALAARADAAQRARTGKGEDAPAVWNGRLSGAQLIKTCPMTAGAETLLKQAYEHYALSMRARTKLIKVSRTIADLEGEETIAEAHMAEAIAYRGVGTGGDHGGF
jgi:magnesium chelatase family protein